MIAPGPAAQPQASGPPLGGALKQQFGLKLVPTVALISTLIVDHIEEPTPN
jgi:uncharacterized protein (TIGR03435 family)